MELVTQPARFTRSVVAVSLALAWAGCAGGGPADTSRAQGVERARQPTRSSMVVYGEGASLFGGAGPNRLPEGLRTEVWQAFVEAIRERPRAAVFALGNHARLGNEQEWRWTREGLATVDCRKYLIRGPQDSWDIPGYGELDGRGEQGFVDIGRSRFIMIDAGTEYDAEFVGSLERALVGSRERANTFVMMHDRSFGLDDTASRWHRDVVPLLLDAGVRYVFCSERDHSHVMTRRVPRRGAGAENEPLFYFCCGFSGASKGPAIYVELEFEGDELVGIVPRCLPLDLRHPWFHGDLAQVEGTGVVKTHGAWRRAHDKSGRIEKMAVWGHSYSLHTDNHNEGRIVGPDSIRALIDELNRTDVRHSFAMGDLVFDSRSETEWELIEAEYARFRGTMHLARGNHEWFEDVPVFDRMRENAEQHYEMVQQLDPKTEGKVVDIGRNRFVMFDYRNSYSARDIEFLEAALHGHESRPNTFFMTHLMSFGGRPIAQAPDGVDPFRPYTGYSNFNDEVAPLLAGRVRYALFGDIFYGLAGHYVAPSGCYYLCSGFGFRGDSAYVYLELEFLDDELHRVRPRTVPIDLRDEVYWYEYSYSYPVQDILSHFKVDAPTFVTRLRQFDEELADARFDSDGGQLSLFGTQRVHDVLAGILQSSRVLMK